MKQLCQITILGADKNTHPARYPYRYTINYNDVVGYVNSTVKYNAGDTATLCIKNYEQYLGFVIQ